MPNYESGDVGGKIYRPGCVANSFTMYCKRQTCTSSAGPFTGNTRTAGGRIPDLGGSSCSTSGGQGDRNNPHSSAASGGGCGYGGNL